MTIDFSAWDWPQWVLAGVYAFNIVTAAVLNGQPKTDAKHDFAVTTVASAVGITILSFGGFFA